MLVSGLSFSLFFFCFSWFLSLSFTVSSNNLASFPHILLIHITLIIIHIVPPSHPSPSHFPSSITLASEAGAGNLIGLAPLGITHIIICSSSVSLPAAPPPHLRPHAGVSRLNLRHILLRADAATYLTPPLPTTPRTPPMLIHNCLALFFCALWRPSGLVCKVVLMCISTTLLPSVNSSLFVDPACGCTIVDYMALLSEEWRLASGMQQQLRACVHAWLGACAAAGMMVLVDPGRSRDQGTDGLLYFLFISRSLPPAVTVGSRVGAGSQSVPIPVCIAARRHLRDRSFLDSEVLRAHSAGLLSVWTCPLVSGPTRTQVPSLRGDAVRVLFFFLSAWQDVRTRTARILAQRPMTSDAAVVRGRDRAAVRLGYS